MTDKGPWSIYTSQDGTLVGVISDDFEHDVVLRVDGDFEGAAQRLAYCEWLAAKLNLELAERTMEGT